MDIQKTIQVLEDLVYEDINQEDYWKAVKDAKVLIKQLKQQCNIADVVGQSEQLVCNCQGCGEEKIIEYCEKCYAESLPDLAS